MGDTGSLFLGFLLAAVGIKLRFPSNSVAVTWLIPVLVLGLPIFDTTLVFISRLRRGLNPLTAAGKDHLSHRLARLTGSRREAVLICYLISGAIGLAAVFLTQAVLSEAIVIGLGLLLLGVSAVWWLEFRQGGMMQPIQATGVRWLLPAAALPPGRLSVGSTRPALRRAKRSGRQRPGTALA